MALSYSTVAEYDEEITFVKAQIRKSITGEEWSLNTSQSTQRVKMASLDKLQKYLQLLTYERKACSERLAGLGVTSIVPRRTY